MSAHVLCGMHIVCELVFVVYVHANNTLIILCAVCVRGPQLGEISISYSLIIFMII